MVSVVYQPADTRWGDLGAALGAGLAQAGVGFGKKRKQDAKAAALQAILSGPDQTSTGIHQAIVSNSAFADDPAAALAIADSMQQAKEHDLQGAKAKIILNALYNSNKDAFKGVDPSTFDQLGADQAMSLAGHLTDAFAAKQQMANEQRRTDIAQQEANQQAAAQKAQIGLGYAQIAATKEENLARLKQDQTQFQADFGLKLKRNDLDERQFAVDTLVKEHGMKAEDARTAIDQASLEDKKAGTALDRERLVQQGIQFQQNLQAETARTEAEAARAAADRAQAESHFQTTEARQVTSDLETQRHNLAIENKPTTETAGAQAAASVSTQYGVSPEVAARVIKEQPLLIGGIVGQFKGQYDPATDSFSFSTAATPSDRAQANVALYISGENFARANGDSGKAIAQSANDAQQLYDKITGALDAGTSPQEIVQKIVAVGKVTGHNFTGNDATIIYQQVQKAYDQLEAIKNPK